MTITMSTDNIVLPAGSLGNDFTTTRNVLYNGDFRVNQRAAASYTSSSFMNLDRWSTGFNYGGVSVSQQTTANFPGYFYRATVTSAAAVTSGSFFWLATQLLEGADVVSLNLGIAAGYSKKVTVSFWARSSIAGTYSVMLGARNSAGTWYYSFQTYSITTANKWQYQYLSFQISSAYTCPAPTVDNNFSFGVWFVGGIGSTYQGTVQNTFSTSVFAGTSSNVNLIGTNGATFDLAKVQIEPGSYPSQFEFVPYALELKRCMRYYQKSYAYATTVATSTFDGAYGYTWTQQRSHSYSTFSFWYTIPFQTRMRVAPTVTVYGASGGTAGVFSIDKGSYVNGTATFNQISDSNFQIYGPNPASLGKAGVEQFYGAYIQYRAVCDAATN